MDEMEPLDATFHDEAALTAASDLAVVCNKEDDDLLHQLEANLACEDGDVTLRTLVGWGTGEAEREQGVDLDDYLALWRTVVATGFPARAMEGELPEAGSDVYLVGSAGPLGLGWMASTTWDGLAADPGAATMAAAILEFAAAREPAVADRVPALLPPSPATGCSSK